MVLMLIAYNLGVLDLCCMVNSLVKLSWRVIMLQSLITWTTRGQKIY